jgi:outer membrane biosynthesis protein TonB
MRTSTLVAVLLAAAAGTATAQTPDQQPPPDPNTPTPPPNPPNQPEVVVQQPPPPNPSPVSPIPEPMPAPPQNEWRPPEFSIGIGIGYQFPTSLETPNVATVRFRLPSGLTFEPTLALASTTDTVDTGDPVDDKTTQLGLGTLIRFPMVAHGRVDLELLGAINVDNVNQNPDGEDDETTTTAVTLNYGLAVTSWINRHWAVSFSALNPLVSFAKVRQEMGPMNVLVTSTTTLGAIFDPTVLVTVHLYH